MTEAETPRLKCLVVPVTPFQQNCSIVWDEASMRGAVVDPGGDLESIERAIAQSGAAIEKVLLTHGHLDHAAAAGTLAARLGVPIEGPERSDRFLIDGLAEQAARYGMGAVDPFVPDRWLVAGDTVTVGGLAFEVRHCPGHTPGHIILFCAAARFALVGDVLFRGSIGRTDLPGGDSEALIRSIREQLWPLGDDVVFLPGHGPASTFGDERRSNPFVGEGA
jgi:hydroxyacylglutathione hydrolase